MTSYAYRIDSRDTIVWCSESWDDFAVANEAPEACGEAILGHSVWQYFEGFETRHLYRMCFNRVRSGLGDIVLPFRCDGPTTIREMKLRISLCRNKLLQNTGTVIRETSHRLPQFLFQQTTRPERIMSICGWCKRVESGGVWFDIDDAARAWEAFNGDSQPAFSHGICPSCRKLVTRELSGSEA